MKIILMTLVLILLTSCARINQRENDHYESKHMRHGIFPYSTSIYKKMKQVSIDNGKVIYQKHCFSCHGEKGLGDGPLAGNQKTPPANLKKTVEEVKNFKFFMSISEWDGQMPGWKEPFNEADKDDLVAYIKTFAKNR